MNHNRVAIIGAGPAGIACAVQLKRYEIEPVLFEKNKIGGLLRNANLVENYLGFETGLSGNDLVEKFKKNLENLNITPIFSEVKNVSFLEGNFQIRTNKDFFTSEILVVASGTTPKMSDFNISDSFADLDKDSCNGKKFVIIGAGDAAFDYAINLVNNYNISEVIVLNRNDKAKCLPLLEKRAEETGKIKHIRNICVESLENTQEKSVLTCINENKYTEIQTDFVISAVGRVPCTDFIDYELLKNSLNLQNNGLLYFIGDVTNNNYRQTAIATGDGIKTAMQIYANY